MSVAEALSPELVLVGADLRAEAIASLPDRPLELYVRRDTVASPVRHAEPSAPPRSIDAAFIARILVYSAWHAVLGALLGVGVVLAVALGLLLLSYFAA
jgi:hypothetical protein